MKNIIIIGIIIAIIVTMPMAVFAAEEDFDTVEINDSLKISAEVKQQLGAEASEKVIKIYNLSIHMAFAGIHSIDELLEKEDLILSEYYAVQSADGMLNYKSIVNNMAVDLSNVLTNQKAMKEFQDNTVATKILSDSEVFGTYYLSGETCYSGTAIYYKTNKGDFVYYSHYAIGDSEYLFPIKDFCEYQRAIYDEMTKYADLDGGVDISQLWDLSKYDIHSTDFCIKTNVQQQLGVEDHQQQNNAEGTLSSNFNRIENIFKWGVVVLGVIFLLAASIFIGVRVNNKKNTSAS